MFRCKKGDKVSSTVGEPREFVHKAFSPAGLGVVDITPVERKNSKGFHGATPSNVGRSGSSVAEKDDNRMVNTADFTSLSEGSKCLSTPPGFPTVQFGTALPSGRPVRHRLAAASPAGPPTAEILLLRLL